MLLRASTASPKGFRRLCLQVLDLQKPHHPMGAASMDAAPRGPGQSGPRAHPTLVIREGLDREVTSPYAYNGVMPRYLIRARHP